MHMPFRYVPFFLYLNISRTTADGNCLFNACSIALCGTEDLAVYLRCLTSIELYLNARGEPIIGKTSAKPINRLVFSQSAIGRLSSAIGRLCFTISMVSGVIKKLKFKYLVWKQLSKRKWKHYVYRFPAFSHF